MVARADVPWISSSLTGMAWILTMVLMPGALPVNGADQPYHWQPQVDQLSERKRAAIEAVARATVAAEPEANEEASRRLLQVTTALQELAAEIAAARAQLDQRRADDRTLDAKLTRWQQQLLVDAVSLALMQTELYPPGSDDRIAAATRAERAIDEASERLPADATARNELQRLRVQAMLRGGQTERAAEALVALTDPLTREGGGPLPPQLLALQIRIDMLQDNVDRAARRLADYYGETASAAPASIDMDLVRLEYLARFDPPQAADWLDALEARHDALTRRRAEQSLLGPAAAGSARALATPTLIAAQGRRWLRQGQPRRAGELLARAAAAEPHSGRAIQYAIEAAAALESVAALRPGAEVLIGTAREHPAAEGADQIHLHGIYLLAQTDAGEVERLLRDQLQGWPHGESARAARRWLFTLLTDRQRWVDAAEVLTIMPADAVTDDDVSRIVTAWHTAFQQAAHDEVTGLIERFQAAAHHLHPSDVWQAHYRSLASVLLDQNALGGLPSPPTGEPPFVEAFIQFRQRAVTSEALGSPPPDLVEVAARRLLHDGRLYPQSRLLIATVVSRWPGQSEASYDAAERLLWKGQAQAAIEMVRALIDAASDEDEVTVTLAAAERLAAADAPLAREEAIRLWDTLASGSPPTSPLWQHAKVAAIELLQAMGRREEAIRRAKYILLTQPGLDAEARRAYERIDQ